MGKDIPIPIPTDPSERLDEIIRLSQEINNPATSQKRRAELQVYLAKQVEAAVKDPYPYSGNRK